MVYIATVAYIATPGMTRAGALVITANALVI